MDKKELAKGSISYREVVAQGIGGAAPAMASLVTLTGAAAYSYGALPLAVALATVAVLLDATRLSITSRYIQQEEYTRSYLRDWGRGGVI
ncbi:MAG: hypothetical protein QXL70_02985 [Metallosphaera sp.]